MNLKTIPHKAFGAVSMRCRAAFWEHPFWHWNTFWVVAICTIANILMNMPSELQSWIAAHAHAAWLLQQVLYVLALGYKFWTNVTPDFPTPPKVAEKQ